MRKMQVNNELIKSVVGNWCAKNLTMYKDKYTIEILDFTGLKLTEAECDEIYAHIEQGTAVDYVRGWFVEARGYEVAKEVQGKIAREIHEFFNVNFLRTSRYAPNTKIYNAILYWLGNVTELAMPEEAIIDSVKGYIEEHYQ